MLFYQVNVELLEAGSEPGRSERMELAAAMRAPAERFFIEQGKNCHIAVSYIMYKKNTAVLCAVVKKGILTLDTVGSFVKAVDWEAKHIGFQEVTLEFYFKMLQTSCRNDYLDNDHDVCETLGLEKLNRNYRSVRLSFSESMLFDKIAQKDLFRQAESLLCDDNMQAEIERIYQGAPAEMVVGHPVHYLLQAEDYKANNQMLRLLLTALRQNGRIQSARYTQVCFTSCDSLSHSSLKALYESSTDGTVVVSYADSEEEEAQFARTGTDVISELCDIMRQYRNKVLTVFCIRRQAEKTKNVFLEHLGAVTIVPIAQETAFGTRAKSYLRARAKEYGTTADKALYKSIAEGKGYTAADLNLAFDEWYDQQLKSKHYTQYAELATANRQVAARQPKGSAYGELERMVGLAEAKKVIKQALDFYKAQKLFKAQGFSRERPAMHMVFTGNPGTAKTTVARLFAQIMKDNELLSVGDLYEVGRADLVGKFVGHTAPLVKAKFKAAKGSVLFIDEAYSLVEHRDGLYGDEAINTIVQEMENHREDMIVIFAGYPDKMEGFLQKNPGLRSRIAFHVPFADYNADELCQITELLAAKKELQLEAGVGEKLKPIYEAAMKDDDFGNGRYARNVFEKAVLKQASRLVAMDIAEVSGTDIAVLVADDFEAPAAADKEKRKIGFAG
ncbi:MAG: AAA family ATPase [Lachnospiraceae bacterium]|jgi:AAA+ superfamily predicted ATPase|nr:AAA family ATPase [Lachnospiraceae bacterium]